MALGGAIGAVWWVMYGLVSRSLKASSEPFFDLVSALFLTAWAAHLLLLWRFRSLVAGIVLGTLLVPVVLLIIAIWLINETLHW